MHTILEAMPNAPIAEDAGPESTEPADVSGNEILDLLTLILDGSLSALDLCRHLALLPEQLADLLASPPIARQLDALVRLDERRGDLIATRARPGAIGTLARAADGQATVIQRLAAAQLVRLTDPKRSATATPRMSGVGPCDGQSARQDGATTSGRGSDPALPAADADPPPPPPPAEGPRSAAEPHAAGQQGPPVPTIFTPTPSSRLAAGAGTPAAVQTCRRAA